MSVAFLVIYEGRPEDPEAFLRYYAERHVPLVWKFPKIRRIEIERGIDGGDFFMITRLTFDSIEDLRAAVSSEERERARADMKNFPPFEGAVRRQVVEIMDMPRPAN
jgi:uncharacterized protein (TIGR02118 family)